MDSFIKKIPKKKFPPENNELKSRPQSSAITSVLTGIRFYKILYLQSGMTGQSSLPGRGGGELSPELRSPGLAWSRAINAVKPGNDFKLRPGWEQGAPSVETSLLPIR